MAYMFSSACSVLVPQLLMKGYFIPYTLATPDITKAPGTQEANSHFRALHGFFLEHLCQILESLLLISTQLSSQCHLLRKAFSSPPGVLHHITVFYFLHSTKHYLKLSESFIIFSFIFSITPPHTH